MPVRDVAPPHKKRKVEPSSKHTYQFKTASEIRHVFKAQSEGGLVEGEHACISVLIQMVNVWQV